MKIPRNLLRLLHQPSKPLPEERIIEQPSRKSKFLGLELLELLAIASVTFFLGTGQLALIGPDEPRYAEIAREMFVTGDYITPTLCGCPWFEKPALYYWIGAISYRLFGVGEFAARFPSGLAATLTMVAVYLAIRQTGSRQWARFSGLSLATSGIMIAYSHAATPDMLLTMAMSVAILSVYRAAQSSGGREVLYLAVGGAFLALSFLAKGLVGVVLICAILVIFLVITGRVRFLSWRAVLAGAAVFLLFSSAWYLPVIWRHGWQFVDEFFLQHHLRRYVSNVYGHPQPFYFFAVIAFLGVVPWSFLLIPAVARLRSLRPREHEGDALFALAWIWLGLPLVFFSLSGSKLPGYILPVFPALSFLIGAEIEDVRKGATNRCTKLGAWLTALTLAMLSLGFIWYLYRRAYPFTIGPWAFSIFVLLSAVIVLSALAAGAKKQFVPGVVAGMLGIIVGGVVLVLPGLNEEISLKRLSQEAAAALRPEEKIGYYILKEYAAVFYAEGRVVCGLGEGDVLNALREDKLIGPLEIYPSLIFITRERWLEGLMRDSRFEKEMIARQGEYYAIRLRLTRRVKGD